MDWSIFTLSYGYSVSNEGNELSRPCESCSPTNILSNATPIFLERDIFNHTSTSIELNQEISHRLDIADLKDKNHFFKMDDFGDKIEVAAIIDEEELTLAYLNRQELDNYLAISDSVLIRFFHICVFSNPIPCNSSEDIIKLSDKGHS